MIVFILLLFSYTSFSQISNYRETYKYETPYMYSVGLSTKSILFDHPARKTIFYDNIDDYTSGGSFDGAQSGIDLRFTYIPENLPKFYFSGGLEYVFLRAKEQYTVSNSSAVNYQNKIDLITPYLGAYYRIFRIPLANTNIYVGPELRFNFVRPLNFKSQLQNILDRNLTEIFNKRLKENTFRLGSAIRIGAEGELNEEIGVNISMCFNYVNLIGKDDSLGELFTSGLVKENTEIELFSLLFNISIFYRL